MSNRSQFFLLPLDEARPPRAFVVFLTLLASLYTPFVWILFQGGPWDPKRWALLKSAPALPGLFIRSIGALSSCSPGINYLAMGSATLLLLAAFFKLGRQSRLGLFLAFLGLVAISSWNSWMAFQSFHSP